MSVTETIGPFPRRLCPLCAELAVFCLLLLARPGSCFVSFCLRSSQFTGGTLLGFCAACGVLPLGEGFSLLVPWCCWLCAGLVSLQLLPIPGDCCWLLFAVS